jgi:hypothetical protein
MSAQQVQRLQTLLETVQRNRQRPGAPIGTGTNTAAASVVQNKPAANQAAAAEPPSRPRIPPQEPKAAPAPAQAAQRPAAAKTAAAAPAQPPSQPKVPLRPEPQVAPQAQEPIVPRTIEPDVPRPATRPIAQLVSKHAPVVDATFGAMLKRSLSLRPH